MKLWLFISCFLFSLSSLASEGVQCLCDDPSFTKRDRDMAVFHFMETKMNIVSNDITSLRELEAKPFLKKMQKPLSFIIDHFTSDELAPCERQCMAAQNERSKIEVTFIDDNGNDCLQKLIVEMTSSTLVKGFKSKVMKKEYPICD